MPFTAVLFDLDETLLIDDASTDQALIDASALAKERSTVDPRALAEGVRPSLACITYLPLCRIYRDQFRRRAMGTLRRR
jgi:hypothetical protein